MSCDLAKLNQIKEPTARVRYFDEGQGGKSEAVLYKGCYVWESGSWREQNQNGYYGVLQDATWIDKNDSQQVKQILWYRIRYTQARLQQAIEKFEVAKKGGGYIYYSDHSVPNNVSFAQYQRVMDLVKKYGKYS